MNITSNSRILMASVLIFATSVLIAACGIPSENELAVVDSVADDLIDESNEKRTEEAMEDTSIDKDLYYTVIEGGVLIDPVDDLIPSCPRDGEPEAGAGPPWADVTGIEQVGPNEFWLTFNGDLQSVLEDDISQVASLNISLILTFPDGATVEYRKEWWGRDEGGSEEHPPSGDIEAEKRYSATFVFIDGETLRIKLFGEEDIPYGTKARVAVHVAEAGSDRPRSCDQVGGE